MKVVWLGYSVTDNGVVAVFHCRDQRNKVRRPTIELNIDDLTRLVEAAKAARGRQQSLARKHSLRADAITKAGVAG